MSERPERDRAAVPIVSVDVAAYDIPTDAHESDGTLQWDSVTVVVEVLDTAVTTLLGTFHDGVEVYGSGGFTSYTVEQLCDQLAGWVARGIPRVKMKVGRDTAADPARVAAARKAVGDDVELYVDANGAWTRKQALAMAWRLADFDVRWLEEPVTSDVPRGCGCCATVDRG